MYIEKIHLKYCECSSQKPLKLGISQFLTDNILLKKSSQNLKQYYLCSGNVVFFE